MLPHRRKRVRRRRDGSIVLRSSHRPSSLRRREVWAKRYDGCRIEFRHPHYISIDRLCSHVSIGIFIVQFYCGRTQTHQVSRCVRGKPRGAPSHAGSTRTRRESKPPSSIDRLDHRRETAVAVTEYLMSTRNPIGLIAR